jgi:hypothetical protein
MHHGLIETLKVALSSRNHFKFFMVAQVQGIVGSVIHGT